MLRLPYQLGSGLSYYSLSYSLEFPELGSCYGKVSLTATLN